MASGESTRSRSRVALRTSLVVTATLIFAACSAPEYSSPAWSGRIVDSETGASIEGAVVVVRWEVETFHAAVVISTGFAVWSTNVLAPV